MTNERRTRKVYMHTEQSAGDYNFNNGEVAFSDITQRVKPPSDRKEYYKEKNLKYAQARKEKKEKNSKRDYHTKHG